MNWFAEPALVDRCSACGQEIYDGDTAWQGPDGELYCSETCVADAMSTAVTVDREEHRPNGSTPTWTYDEAVLMGQAYDRLWREDDELVRLWRRLAREHRSKGWCETAQVYELCADRLEEAMKKASPAMGGVLAGDGSLNGGR